MSSEDFLSDLVVKRYDPGGANRSKGGNRTREAQKTSLQPSQQVKKEPVGEKEKAKNKDRLAAQSREEGDAQELVEEKEEEVRQQKRNGKEKKKKKKKSQGSRERDQHGGEEEEEERQVKKGGKGSKRKQPAAEIEDEEEEGDEESHQEKEEGKRVGESRGRKQRSDKKKKNQEESQAEQSQEKGMTNVGGMALSKSLISLFRERRKEDQAGDPLSSASLFNKPTGTSESESEEESEGEQPDESDEDSKGRGGEGTMDVQPSAEKEKEKEKEASWLQSLLQRQRRIPDAKQIAAAAAAQTQADQQKRLPSAGATDTSLSAALEGVPEGTDPSVQEALAHLMGGQSDFGSSVIPIPFFLETSLEEAKSQRLQKRSDLAEFSKRLHQQAVRMEKKTKVQMGGGSGSSQTGVGAQSVLAGGFHGRDDSALQLDRM
uniref:Uncharacterized protein n=1 Tax=Chromera velia CCMP2878 TaxID=1169474 RepID=A0A0G4HDY2_9ALVE|eukprot:Cvel_26601.t1-p1 / transcript=Cvel_26601.t1 / gene=Cvel_26601 / organism=Chromera_velia_CCMP2878 / gene_product=hypothetical protein / transcript_product=hypothetical protein / location=Cvel_scaffold3189:9761-12359(+) / protein_length=431 / sequence_SO=supercontig / SO=protein_coding / is_pseudo=false